MKQSPSLQQEKTKRILHRATSLKACGVDGDKFQSETEVSEQRWAIRMA